MTRLKSALAACVAAAIIASPTTPAFAIDYPTEGFDIARTGWVRGETQLTKANLGKMKLLWKKQLPAVPRVMHNLHGPLIAESVQTPAGAREIAIVAGVSDQLWGLDAKTGDVLWERKFEYTGPNATLGNNLPSEGSDVLCPGGQTAQPTMEKLGPGSYKVWALAADGRLYQINPGTGQDIAAPVKAFPYNGKAYALNLHNGYIYTAYGQGCGAAFQFDAYNIRTQRATALYPAGGGLWGRRGAAIDSNGIAYMGTGDQVYRPSTGNLGNIIVGARPDATGELKLENAFAPINANWLFKRDLDVNVSPMVVAYRGKEYMVGTSKACQIWLVDIAEMSKPDHRTTVDDAKPCNDLQRWDEKGPWGSLSAGQTADGRTWLYVPFWGEASVNFKPPVINTPRVPTTYDASAHDGQNGGVAAYTIEQVGGKPKMVPRWLSQNMNMAEEGLLANDIFWVYSSGIGARQTVRDIAYNDTAARFGSRWALSTKAKIYALDAKTGKTLWDSGDQIASWNHFTSISLANGKVYLGTFDGMMYAFGVEN